MPPFNLQEETQALQDLDTYHIAHEHDIDHNDQAAIAGLLAGPCHARRPRRSLTFFWQGTRTRRTRTRMLLERTRGRRR